MNKDEALEALNVRLREVEKSRTYYVHRCEELQKYADDMAEYNSQIVQEVRFRPGHAASRVRTYGGYSLAIRKLLGGNLSAAGAARVIAGGDIQGNVKNKLTVMQFAPAEPISISYSVGSTLSQV
jgi:hypothetical protein